MLCILQVEDRIGKLVQSGEVDKTDLTILVTGTPAATATVCHTDAWPPGLLQGVC